LAYASAAQLRDVFDDDWWANEEPGEDARFDAARFGVWLEVLLEAGDHVVVEKLSELSEDLVTLAFHSHVHVVHVDALMAEVSEADDELLEKAMSDALSEEIDEYHVFARRADGWDAVLTTLLAFDRDRHHDLVRLLERLARATASEVEDLGGLYEVLGASETLEIDAAAEREERRAKKGYVAPSDARAFLASARSFDPARRDPVAAAYFRELDREATQTPAIVGPRARGGEDAHAPRRLARRASEALSALVAEVETAPLERDEKLVTALERALERLPADLRIARSEELAYLANVVVEGVVVNGRRPRPYEAVRAALGMVNLGLELAVVEAGPSADDDALRVLALVSCDQLFRRALAHAVKVFAEAISRSSLSPSNPTRIAASAPFPHAIDARGEPTFVDSLAGLEARARSLVPSSAQSLVRAREPDVTTRSTSRYPGGAATAPRSRKRR
jgi:hypothetical protein